MISLLLFVLTGLVTGSVSGGLWAGLDGVVLGGSAGLVLGVTCWAAGIAGRQLREAQQGSQFADLVEQDRVRY